MNGNVWERPISCNEIIETDADDDEYYPTSIMLFSFHGYITQRTHIPSNLHEKNHQNGKNVNVQRKAKKKIYSPRRDVDRDM